MLVKEIRLGIGQLALSFMVRFFWIPSHADIAGNEVADLLAKRGANDIFY